jgi:hypothetical protein
MAYIYDLTDTWNAGGTTFNAIKMNVTDSASAAASKLVTLQTNGTEHFSVTKGGVGYFSGNVGIGTASPGGYKLAVNSASNLLALSDGSTQNLFVTVTSGAGSAGAFTFNANNGGQFIWQNAGAEKMRLDGSGNLLINRTTTSGYGKLNVDGGADFTGGNVLLCRDTGNVGIGTSSPGSKLTVTGTVSATGVSEGFRMADATPYLTFYNAAQSTRFGYIQHTGTALALVNEQAGQMEFYTNNTERMRIDTSGNLLVGTTDAGMASGNGIKIHPTYGGSGVPNIGVVTGASTGTTTSFSSYSTGAAAYRFYVDNAGTIFATNTSISAISDIRLKENVRDLDAGLDAILALKPRRFDWKQGKGKNVKDDIGFIAQEVEQVLPQLIGGWKAGEGEPDDLKSVKASDLIPILVKAIQELTARVAQLEGN